MRAALLVSILMLLAGCHAPGADDQDRPIGWSDPADDDGRLLPVPCDVAVPPIPDEDPRIQLTPLKSEWPIGEPNCLRVTFNNTSDREFTFERTNDPTITVGMPLMVNVTNVDGAGTDWDMAGRVHKVGDDGPHWLRHAPVVGDRFAPGEGFDFSVWWSGEVSPLYPEVRAEPGLYNVSAFFLGRNHTWDVSATTTLRLLAHDTAPPPRTRDCRGHVSIIEPASGDLPRFDVRVSPRPWPVGTWGCIVVAMNNTADQPFVVQRADACADEKRLVVEVALPDGAWRTLYGGLPAPETACMTGFWTFDLQPGETWRRVLWWDAALPDGTTVAPGTYSFRAGFLDGGPWPTLVSGDIILADPNDQP